MGLFNQQDKLFKAINDSDYTTARSLNSRGVSLARGKNNYRFSKREETPLEYAKWRKNLTLDQLKAMDPSNSMYSGLQNDLQALDAIIKLIG